MFTYNISKKEIGHLGVLDKYAAETAVAWFFVTNLHKRCECECQMRWPLTMEHISRLLVMYCSLFLVCLTIKRGVVILFIWSRISLFTTHTYTVLLLTIVVFQLGFVLNCMLNRLTSRLFSWIMWQTNVWLVCLLYLGQNSQNEYMLIYTVHSAACSEPRW